MDAAETLAAINALIAQAAAEGWDEKHPDLMDRARQACAALDTVIGDVVALTEEC